MKTAVSEAVTNCIIHGYQGEVHKIRMKCVRKERTIYLDIEDDGIGIADVEKAMEAMKAAGDIPYVIGTVEAGEKGVSLC